MSVSQSSPTLNNRLTVLAAEITEAVAGVHRDALSMAEHALRAGRGLIEAKGALQHGAWDSWLRANVKMSPRSARRYMALAAKGLEPATVAKMGIRAAAGDIARGPALTAAYMVKRALGPDKTAHLIDRLQQPDGEEFFCWLIVALKKRSIARHRTELEHMEAEALDARRRYTGVPHVG